MYEFLRWLSALDFSDRPEHIVEPDTGEIFECEYNEDEDGDEYVLVKVNGTSYAFPDNLAAEIDDRTFGRFFGFRKYLAAQQRFADAVMQDIIDREANR